MRGDGRHKDVPLLNRSPHSGGCSSYQRNLSSYQSLVPGFMHPARPETEPTRGSFIFQRRRLGGPDCEAYWQRRTTWLCVYKRFQYFTRHISLDVHAHGDGFKTKRLGREIAGAPQGGQLRFPRQFRSQGGVSEWSREFQSRDTNHEQREELRRVSPCPRRSATISRQLPHPTEEVHGCRSGDQAVPWQQCGNGTCGHWGSLSVGTWNFGLGFSQQLAFRLSGRCWVAGGVPAPKLGLPDGTGEQ